MRKRLLRSVDFLSNSRRDQSQHSQPRTNLSPGESNIPHSTSTVLQDAESSTPAVTSQVLLPQNIEDNVSITELWTQAYEKLRIEDKGLVEKYEKNLNESLRSEQNSAIEPGASIREKTEIVLKDRMDEVNRNQWKIRFGTSEIPVKEVVQNVVSVINWTDAFVKSAIGENLPASIAWAGVSLLLVPISNSSEQLAKLAAGLEEISSLITQSKLREKLYRKRYELTVDATRDLQGHAEYKGTLEALYVQILKFQATSYNYYIKHSRPRVLSDMVAWNDWETMLQDVQQKNNEFEEVNKIWKDENHYEEWVEIRRYHEQSLTQWSGMAHELSGLREAITCNEKDKERKDILKWLCDIDPSSMYNTNCNAHVKGTNNWLLEDSPEFKKLATTPRSFLWLHGKAGSGKSVLSSSVISHLKDKVKRNSTMALAYFYFSFSDQKKQTVAGMLSSLIKQFCACRPNIPRDLGEYKVKDERPSLQLLQEMLAQSMSGFSAAFIVIDGLDECPEQNENQVEERDLLLVALGNMAAADNVHIFCTSRKEHDISVAMKEILADSSHTNEIDLADQQHQKHIDQDIGLFIDTKLKSKGANFWPVEIRKKAKTKLLQKADGMIQYVSYQFQALSKCATIQEVDNALEDLPDGLDKIYERILESIDEKSQEKVLRVLKWLVCSGRRLTTNEVAEIFVFCPENTHLLSDTERLFDDNLVLKQLSSLVISEKHISFSGTYTYVRLAHFSVKEYLTSDRISKGRSARFGFNEMDAMVDVMRGCLVYLLQCTGDENEEIYSGNDGFNLRRIFRLYEYASQFWPVHFENTPRECWQPELSKFALRAFTMRSRSLASTLNCYHLSGIKKLTDQDFMLRPYLYTAVRGFIRLTEMLFSAHQYLTKEDLDVALQCAASSESPSLVELILEKGADVNAKSAELGDALQQAATRRGIYVVTLLLDRGADASANVWTDLEAVGYGYFPYRDGVCGSALQAAMANGHMATVRLLLNRGARIDLNSKDTSLVIASAVTPNSVECLQFVLEMGVEMGVEINNKGGRALHRAARMGNIAAVRMLLEKGVDVNAQGGWFGNALQAACVQYDGEELVRFLVKAGANVNSTGGYYGTALQASAHRSHGKITRFLVENGADVTIVRGKYGNALQAALGTTNSFYDDPPGIELFSGQRMCSVVAEGSVYGTALQAAGIRLLQPHLMKQLLSNGANVNAQGGFFGTALQAACRVGSLEAARMLLDHGAQVNLVGGVYGTALQAACSKWEWKGAPNLQIVRLLLNNHADVQIQGGYYGSAWHAAAANCAPDVLEVFLQCGIDVNDARGERHPTALQAALQVATCYRNHTAKIQFLLNHGADPTLAAGKYGLPLQWACTAESQKNPLPDAVYLGSLGEAYRPDWGYERVKFLLDTCSTIDVNAKSGLFNTALQAAAYMGSAKLVQLLLDRGAQCDVYGAKYGNALNAAVIKGHWDSVDVLLKAGAVPDCHRVDRVDEEWLLEVEKDDGQGAVQRYRKFWEVQSDFDKSHQRSVT
ncbi:uncharacterized protein BP5553_08492 [Venustampulla echinocandica]|uniref:NACHT domain-containing protein n=1 Tax=Venustampulla echinocandica TaxID=2656787 RepID=A0A370TED1_9HELO|nr:uncharacterized protein BP5553_08492 [Venustampulla echinocandica]RDL33053.1 hypothetical protein BP5553_08492 [Venustampulla echinocandica]